MRPRSPAPAARPPSGRAVPERAGLLLGGCLVLGYGLGRLRALDRVTVESISLHARTHRVH